MALSGQIGAYAFDLVLADDESLSGLDAARGEPIWSLGLCSHRESP
jgi:hypothetical protein